MNLMISVMMIMIADCDDDCDEVELHHQLELLALHRVQLRLRSKILDFNAKFITCFAIVLKTIKNPQN